MIKKLSLSFAILFGANLAYSNEFLFKEYFLKDGESIAKLINNVDALKEEDKLELIEKSLRVNRLTSEEARLLPVNYSVLIPVNVYKHYEGDISPSEPIMAEPVSKVESEVLDQEIQNDKIVEDQVTQRVAAIQKINLEKLNSKNEAVGLYARVGIENTNLNTKETGEDADVQSISIGISTPLSQKMTAGISISKNISAENESFMSDLPSWKVGGSFELYREDLSGLDLTASFESVHHNFTGLNIARMGELNLQNTYIGALAYYQLSDKVTLSFGGEYALASKIDNKVPNGIELENKMNYQLELSANYQYIRNQQVYLSVLRQSNEWESGSRVINYDSNLLKAGLILAF